MKTMVTTTLTAVLCTAVVLVQESATGRQQAVATFRQEGPVSGVAGGGVQTLFGNPAKAVFFAENENPVSLAVAALKKADSDETRRAAEAELRKALENDYDARLEAYASHLDKIEEELARMREQLQKRRMAKSEMVDLRLQVLKAEADDLGWPKEIDSNDGFLRGRAFGFRALEKASSAPSAGIWSTTNIRPSGFPDSAPNSSPNTRDESGR